MATPYSLPQNAKIVNALTPATDAAGRTGAYVSLKNALKAYLVCQVAQGNAATVQVSINQATAVAGTGAKALANVVPVWANQNVATNDTLTRQANAVSFTTSAAVANKVVVFEVDPANLDVAGGFDSVAPVTGASNVANLTAAYWILTPLRFAEDTPQSAVVD
jgi:hypothetical protein